MTQLVPLQSLSKPGLDSFILDVFRSSDTGAAFGPASIGELLDTSGLLFVCGPGVQGKTSFLRHVEDVARRSGSDSSKVRSLTIATASQSPEETTTILKGQLDSATAISLRHAIRESVWVQANAKAKQRSLITIDTPTRVSKKAAEWWAANLLQLAEDDKQTLHNFNVRLIVTGEFDLSMVSIGGGSAYAVPSTVIKGFGRTHAHLLWTAAVLSATAADAPQGQHSVAFPEFLLEAFNGDKYFTIWCLEAALHLLNNRSPSEMHEVIAAIINAGRSGPLVGNRVIERLGASVMQTEVRDGLAELITNGPDIWPQLSPDTRLGLFRSGAVAAAIRSDGASDAMIRDWAHSPRYGVRNVMVETEVRRLLGLERAARPTSPHRRSAYPSSTSGAVRIFDGAIESVIDNVAHVTLSEQGEDGFGASIPVDELPVDCLENGLFQCIVSLVPGSEGIRFMTVDNPDLAEETAKQFMEDTRRLMGLEDTP